MDALRASISRLIQVPVHNSFALPGRLVRVRRTCTNLGAFFKLSVSGLPRATIFDVCRPKFRRTCHFLAAHRTEGSRFDSQGRNRPPQRCRYSRARFDLSAGIGTKWRTFTTARLYKSPARHPACQEHIMYCISANLHGQLASTTRQTASANHSKCQLQLLANLRKLHASRPSPDEVRSVMIE